MESDHGILVLAQVPGITPALMRQVLYSFASIDDFFAATPGACPVALSPIHASYIAGRANYHRAARELADHLAAQNIVTVVLGGPDYPRLLSEIHRPPPLLFVRGDPALLSLPQLAIVGSRRASSGALHNARAFAAELAASGFTVTSGLALGVDGAAHRGAIERGRTIAVLGTGIDINYPRQHRALAERIVDSGGALVSEFPLGFTPRRESFPQRNRIISGLSLGVLVVEAARDSGSLITARLAMEQGREVFAMPGSVHNAQARGCHQLIREGATLTETVTDIVEQLGGLLAYKVEEVAAPPDVDQVVPDGDAGRLLVAMGFDPLAMDTMAERTGLAIPQLTAALVNLELQGLVESRDGLYQRQR